MNEPLFRLDPGRDGGARRRFAAYASTPVPEAAAAPGASPGESLALRPATAGGPLPAGPA